MKTLLLLGALLGAYIGDITPQKPNWENTRFITNFGYENVIVNDDNLENAQPEYYAYGGNTYIQSTYQGAEVWKYWHSEYADQDGGTFGAGMSRYALPSVYGNNSNYSSNSVTQTEGESYPSNSAVTFRISLDSRYRVYSNSSVKVQVSTSLDNLLRHYSWNGENWYSVNTSHTSYWEVTIDLSRFANMEFTNTISGTKTYGASLAGWTLGQPTSGLSVSLSANLVTLEQLYTLGKNDGYSEGLNVSAGGNTPATAFNGLGDFFGKIWAGMGSLINTELFPGFTLGWLIAIPFIYVLVACLIRYMSRGAS